MMRELKAKEEGWVRERKRRNKLPFPKYFNFSIIVVRVVYYSYALFILFLK